ncbi:MAG: imidazoleglycerol-phosphate dehydratase HisB [Actinobacteria bacterium]|nr:imidazoleglycerol-phosphate dehydratase HisB [Actinomycetota bacterium]
MERKTTINRKTGETDIILELNIDGSGNSEIDTPVPFLNHVLSSFARHGSFDLKIIAKGDVKTDPHHLIEDIGICLGKAIFECTKDKKGIKRFGFVIIPMDDAEVTVSLDLGGRTYFRYSVDMLAEKIENFATNLAEDFFRALADNAFINLHINKNAGINSHHIIEAIFKSFGIALASATGFSGRDSVPSTKGSI